ncbi:MAG: 7-carboxy-7-deazaguanine synthase QueE [SAR202 cluster bacterium]|nr:7-carboxy-7-deazaguanine synthase QueE [SAR202 cluster bacterium]
MLKVSRQPSGDPEIFHSIQGEGVSAGTPTVFLRLATCNLACTWCDTRYTWDWRNFDYADGVVEMALDEMERRVLEFGRPRLVITGGEPLLQQAVLAPLVSSLAGQGLYCELETNGTIVPSPDMIEGIAQWNVSPKLENSGNMAPAREVPDALYAFGHMDTAYFKFVIVAPPDVDEVAAIVDRYGLASERVMLMPEGVTAEAMKERGRWVAEACVERDFSFSPRLHILLWGDERGR